jgi:hypothetical protein
MLLSVILELYNVQVTTHSLITLNSIVCGRREGQNFDCFVTRTVNGTTVGYPRMYRFLYTLNGR